MDETLNLVALLEDIEYQFLLSMIGKTILTVLFKLSQLQPVGVVDNSPDIYSPPPVLSTKLYALQPPQFLDMTERITMSHKTNRLVLLEHKFTGFKKFESSSSFAKEDLQK